MDTKAVTEHIRRILTAPDVDLATISSKKVRKVLAESFGAVVVKENKEAIDSLIIDAFNRIATAAGAAGAAQASNEPANDVRNSTEHVSASQSVARNGHSGGGGSSTQRDRIKQQQPEESAASDNDEDVSASESEAEPSRPQHIKQSPQKKKVTSSAVASSPFPASSPNVPLSMATATLTADEEYARKLQEEYNNASSGGRATRGGASRTTKKTKRGKASTSKAAASEKGSSKRYGSKAYIDDSDLDGEERSNSRGDSDESASDAAPKKKKRKASSGGGGGTGGGYNKELALSEPLQKVCGVPTMSRPQIVKKLWEYIRGHDLQDPNKRSDIINDDTFKEIFGVEKMTMFSMNKYLTKNVSPIDG